MTSQFDTRWVGPVSLFAAAMIILSQGLHLGLGLAMGAQPADNVLHSVKYVLALVAMIALLFALTGLYLRQANAAGRLGMVGFVLAFIGTVLVAGDWWFESFIVPQIAAVAPQVMTGAITGSMAVGGAATFILFALGWTIFGIATFRANVYPRPAAVLLIIGGVIGILALSTPYQVPLAIAIGWIGYSLMQSERARAVVKPPIPVAT
jgi:hypothetical protein